MRLSPNARKKFCNKRISVSCLCSVYRCFDRIYSRYCFTYNIRNKMVFLSDRLCNNVFGLAFSVFENKIVDKSAKITHGNYRRIWSYRVSNTHNRSYLTPRCKTYIIRMKTADLMVCRPFILQPLCTLYTQSRSLVLVLSYSCKPCREDLPPYPLPILRRRKRDRRGKRP